MGTPPVDSLGGSSLLLSFDELMALPASSTAPLPVAPVAVPPAAFSAAPPLAQRVSHVRANGAVTVAWADAPDAEVSAAPSAAGADPAPFDWGDLPRFLEEANQPDRCEKDEKINPSNARKRKADWETEGADASLKRPENPETLSQLSLKELFLSGHWEMILEIEGEGDDSGAWDPEELIEVLKDLPASDPQNSEVRSLAVKFLVVHYTPFFISYCCEDLNVLNTVGAELGTYFLQELALEEEELIEDLIDEFKKLLESEAEGDEEREWLRGFAERVFLTAWLLKRACHSFLEDITDLLPSQSLNRANALWNRLPTFFSGFREKFRDLPHLPLP